MTISILVGFDRKHYPVEIFAELGQFEDVNYNADYLNANIHKYKIIVPHLHLRLNEELLSKAIKLKIIATPSTGTDHIDLDYCRANKIKILSLSDSPEFISKITSTAEMAFLLILACARNFRLLNSRVQDEKSWINTDIRGFELKGKTLGIIGLGRLGMMVAQYGVAFNMRVIAYDPHIKSDMSVFPLTSLETLLQQSDIVSMHPKLNSSSRNMINATSLRNFKPGCIFINTARGELADSAALLEALKSGVISAIGIDVSQNEFNNGSLPEDFLVKASLTDKRIVVTPHAGGATLDAHSKVFTHVKEMILNEKKYLQ